MPVKDHYRTLGVATSASQQEIKQAFRKLAHQYHPDKNNGIENTAALFREIQQAYNALSDPKTRKRYDEERYFAGLSAHKEPQKVSADWLLQQASRLRKHMQRVDSYTMNHQALYDYVKQLISEEHLTILGQEADEQTKKNLLDLLLESVHKLHHDLYQLLIPSLTRLAGTDNEAHQKIFSQEIAKKSRKLFDKYIFFTLIFIALLLCIVMYLYSDK